VEWLQGTKNERKSRVTAQNQQVVFGHCTVIDEAMNLFRFFVGFNYD